MMWRLGERLFEDKAGTRVKNSASVNPFVSGGRCDWCRVGVRERADVRPMTHVTNTSHASRTLAV